MRPIKFPPAQIAMSRFMLHPRSLSNSVIRVHLLHTVRLEDETGHLPSFFVAKKMMPPTPRSLKLPSSLKYCSSSFFSFLFLLVFLLRLLFPFVLVLVLLFFFF